ncbi:response regulator transcription factor [Clostridium sp. 'deep sea']|uniref:response regulator transcription factor n=1 Tax=Clostridium sp. 'deep sea' TaxID=2779445 RepID=UPI00189654C8|nr:response regulator transcription factor [Clostridium sp. 'deep sea']QOR34900.1 response regulator transcription factor [Clostridium sp. 'deep sea']
MNKVLIIEDDINISELERDYLNLNGFKVDIVRTGTEGLNRALYTDYDLVIIDIMLPEINGFEICRTIREKKEIPLIIVSAKTSDIDKIRALGIGADDYLTKPFSPNELVARVKSHLSRYKRLKGEVTNSAVIEINGLSINTKSRQVFLYNKEISFTTKEFDLLVFLASNPNIVFNKETLFDRIWGDEFGDIATVPVHIQKVRKKIENNPSEPKIIETIWGSGYRLNKKSKG